MRCIVQFIPAKPLDLPQPAPDRDQWLMAPARATTTAGRERLKARRLPFLAQIGKLGQQCPVAPAAAVGGKRAPAGNEEA